MNNIQSGHKLLQFEILLFPRHPLEQFILKLNLPFLLTGVRAMVTATAITTQTTSKKSKYLVDSYTFHSLDIYLNCIIYLGKRILNAVGCFLTSFKCIQVHSFNRIEWFLGWIGMHKLERTYATTMIKSAVKCVEDIWTFWLLSICQQQKTYFRLYHELENSTMYTGVYISTALVVGFFLSYKSIEKRWVFRDFMKILSK